MDDVSNSSQSEKKDEAPENQQSTAELAAFNIVENPLKVSLVNLSNPSTNLFPETDSPSAIPKKKP